MSELDVNSGELLNLKALAANRAGFARNALFDRVAGLLFEGEGELTPEVRTLIDQILTGLIHQVEAEVRQQVSLRISTIKSAPLELTKMLANDTIEIARPILHHSPVLTDADLIAIVKAKTIDHREAIAKRPEVHAEVSAALAAAKEPKVVEALLANTGAAIPRNVFADLVALSEAVESIRKPLIARREMPKDIAHQMFWFVSAAMRHAILERFAVNAKELDAMFADIIVEKSHQPSSWRGGDVSALLAKVKAGDLAGFTKGLAQLTGVDPTIAAKIVADKGGEPLAIACKAIGADRSQFTTIFLQLDYKRFGKARPLSHVEMVSKVFDMLPAEKALSAIRMWSRQMVAKAA